MEETIDELYRAAESGDDAALRGENQILPLLFQPIPPGGYTALHIAAYHGQKTFVESLLPLYAQQRSLDLEGPHNFLKVRDAYKKNTALHEAVRGGDRPDIVQLLLRADPTLADDRNKDGESPLFIAAENGHVNAVKELLPRTHRPYGRSDGRTPLHHAIYLKHYELVKAVLHELVNAETGVHELVKAKDREGRTVLHLAALDSKWPEEIVEELLKPDVSLSYKKDNINQQTALHVAVTEGNLRFVRCILRIARRCAEIVDKDGRHALHLALEKGDVNIVKQVLNFMPKRSAEMADKDGRHALHFAVEKADVNIVEELLRIMPRLINLPDKSGCTALDIAIERVEEVGNPVAAMLRLYNGKRGSTMLQVVRTLRSYNGKQGVRKAQILPQSVIRAANEEQREYAEINTLCVMAVLIATVSFQAVIQPPGGTNEKNGLPLLAHTYVFKVFRGLNAIAYFLSVMTAIFLVLSVIFPRALSRANCLILSESFVITALSCMAICFAIAGSMKEYTKGGYQRILLTSYVMIGLTALCSFIFCFWMFLRYRKPKAN